jgi:hypothetical protein
MGQMPQRHELVQRLGSSSICVRNGEAKRNHSGAEEFDASAPIHSPLQSLQAIDLALRLPIAPGFDHRVTDCIEIMQQGPTKPPHSVNSTTTDIIDPGRELVDVTCRT